MAIRTRIHRRMKSMPRAPESAVRIPVQTTFRHMPASPAVAVRVEAEVQKLRRYFDGITHCHVVIVAPHRHHRHGRHYAIHIELAVPNDHLAISHEPAARPSLLTAAQLSRRNEPDASHKDIYVVIREAFDSARRRLEDYVRRQRGDVKRHRLAEVAELSAK